MDIVKQITNIFESKFLVKKLVTVQIFGHQNKDNLNQKQGFYERNRRRTLYDEKSKKCSFRFGCVQYADVVYVVAGSTLVCIWILGGCHDSILCFNDSVLRAAAYHFQFGKKILINIAKMSEWLL